MGFVVRNYVSLEEIDQEVARVVAQLGPEVVRIRYTVTEDMSGEPAIYFRVVLKDEATRREVLRQSTEEVERVIEGGLKAYEKWGLFPYFNYRSASEQAQRSEPEWT